MGFTKIVDQNGNDNFVNDDFMDIITGKITVPPVEKYPVIPSVEEISKFNQMQINKQAKEYLTSTDWYVIRQQETGVPVPQDILNLRIQARTQVVEI